MEFLLKRYWKHLLVGVLLVVILSAVYNRIYEAGYNAARIECAAKIKDYEDKVDRRISSIEDISKKLLNETTVSNESFKQFSSKLLNTTKGTPLFVLDKGVCRPSAEYIRAYNEAIAKANKL